MQLTRLDDALWIHARPLRFLGVETGTRTTIVRLPGGGLFVHSPAPLTPALRAEVDALGPVAAIVAPSLFHHLGVRAWLDAYPHAPVYACPGLDRKRRDVAWTGTLGDSPAPAWAGSIDQVSFAARSLENEVVFCHHASRTLICADAVFNLADHPSRLTRVVARLLGQRAPGPTWLEHVMMRDRRAARAQVDRMLAWDFDRIVLSHGPIVDHGGRDVLRRAYAWL